MQSQMYSNFNVCVVTARERRTHHERESFRHRRSEKFGNGSLLMKSYCSRECENPMVEQPVLDLLCCPVCRSRLRRVDGQVLECAKMECARRFPSIAGRPILINEERSTFCIEDFVAEKPAFFKPAGRVRQFISACLPHLSRNLRATHDIKRLRDLLRNQSEAPQVLIIGGGVAGAGIEALLDDAKIKVLETDAAVTPRVQVVCDAHDLPFGNGSFDAVIAQAVLHHVADAPRCVAEIHRVLKEEGVVYADTGFMVQVHGREFDFARYTPLGHRRLFRYFDEIASGISLGPGTALAWSLKYFFLSFTTSQSLRRAIGGCSRLAFFWLKYFDYFLKSRQAALDAAAGIVFLGRRRAQPITDHELTRSYRGGM